MKLRPYQTESIAGIQEAWDSGVQKTLLVLPTGCGKTIVFCKLTETLVRQGKRVLILAHRGELLNQAADKMAAATGLGCAVEKAEHSCLEGEDQWFRVVVGSVQTLMRQSRLDRFSPDHFDVIIIDEAHHALADSYQRILNYFMAADVLGVTATPDRGDMRGLGEYFQTIAYEYTLPKAIHEEFLAPIKALTIPLKLSLEGVGTQSGDFKSVELGSALDPYLDQIAKEIVGHCKGRLVVVFLPLVATSQKMQAAIQKHGLRCGEVNCGSPDRAEILRDFEAGRYDVLCNSMLLTEGWDCPRVDTIVCLRPTKVRSLYCQMVGRGTRLFEGKDHLLLLDFLWNCDRHELCRPAHLIADSQEVAKKMTENIEAEAGTAVDIEAAEDQAKSDCIEEREANLAEKLEKMRKRKKKLVDPLQFEMSIMDQDLAGYQPSMGWECAPVSDQQARRLEAAGIMPDGVDNAGKADLILDRLDKRRHADLSTPKQIRLLERYGFQHVGNWQFQQARGIIDRIAGNNWRVPYGVNPKTFTPPKIEPQNQGMLI